jgi:hypothetical protein
MLKKIVLLIFFIYYINTLTIEIEPGYEQCIFERTAHENVMVNKI